MSPLALLIWALFKNFVWRFSIVILVKATSCLGSPLRLIIQADEHGRCSCLESAVGRDSANNLERVIEFVLANRNIYVRGREYFQFGGTF
jgi:hypothetical protein